MNLSLGRTQERFGSSLILVASLSAVACGADAEEAGEAPGSVGEAIIGGSAVSVATQRSLGLVDVNGCSGALLGADWVVTATHCVNLRSPSSNTAKVARTDGDTDDRTATVVSQVAQSDITLLKLGPGSAGNQWPTTVSRRASTSQVAPGLLVSCYGQGATAYAFPSGVTGGGWRTLTRSVAHNNGTFLFVRADSGGNNILTPGDSGGSCLLTNGEIAGVVYTTTEVTCTDRTSSETCKDTLTHIAEVALTATQPYANYINSAPSRAATTFRPLTLSAGWAPAFRAYAPGVALVDGVLYLRGAVTTSNTTGSNAVVFTLPSGFRPTAEVYVPITLCGGTKGRLRILTTGETIVETMAGEWSSAACLTSFDGVKVAVGSNWTDISLRNGWATAPFDNHRAAAKVDSQGWVHLRGAIAGGTSNVAFTLAPAFRPPVAVYVPIDLCNSKKGRLHIAASGDATVVQEGGGLDAAQCFTSLEGISFYKANTAGFTSLPPLNGWTGAPFSTRFPAALNSNGTVRFIGSVGTTGTNSHVFTLPAAMRPAGLVVLPIDMCHGNRGRLVIQEDGRAFAESSQPWANVKCFASLEGLSFGI